MRTFCHSYVVTLIIILGTLASCSKEGAMGSEGPAGEDGPEGLVGPLAIPQKHITGSTQRLRRISWIKTGIYMIG